MLAVYGIILAIVGLIMIMKPALIWSITERWKSNDADEPSGLYIFSTRFGGSIMVIISIFCFFALA